MVIARYTLRVALIAFAAAFWVGLLSACTVEELLHLEPSTPPVAAWPKVKLIVDPTLRSPTTPTSSESRHAGAWIMRDEPNPELSLKFDAAASASGQRMLHMDSGSGRFLERFEFAFIPAKGGEFEVGVLGRSWVDYGPPFERRLRGLQGTVTVNTLDWREQEPVHVRIELRYYGEDPSDWSTIEVCSQATPTREE